MTSDDGGWRAGPSANPALPSTLDDVRGHVADAPLAFLRPEDARRAEGSHEKGFPDQSRMLTIKG